MMKPLSFARLKPGPVCSWNISGTRGGLHALLRARKNISKRAQGGLIEIFN